MPNKFESEVIVFSCFKKRSLTFYLLFYFYFFFGGNVSLTLFVSDSKVLILFQVLGLQIEQGVSLLLKYIFTVRFLQV